MAVAGMRQRYLDAYFGRTSLNAPSTLYVGFSTTTPNDSGGNVTEPSGNGYERIAVTNNTTNWPNASTSGGVTTKTNANDIKFPEATGSWGTVTHWVLYEQQTGGTPVYFAALDTAKAITAGDEPYIKAGSMKITLERKSS